MIVDLILTNTKAYIKNNIIDCNIAIENGIIFKIGKETQMPNADEKINLKNLLTLPGLIDAHVHLRDEGKAYKEDFYTGTAAAAAGGFATVLDMPNNEPVTMSRETLQNRMHIAERKILVDVGFYSEFPKNPENIKDIVAEGALAFKLFMAHQVGGLNINSNDALYEAFIKTAEAGVPLAVHAEDEPTICSEEQSLKAAKRDKPSAFLEAHSEEAEEKAIERVLKISAKTKTHIHFCHVSTKKGLERIVDARKSGQTVTCEVTPNHLLLSNTDFEQRGSLLSMMPPPRDNASIETLWQGITDGSIDVMGSDHAPHTLEEKSSSNIWDVKVGVPGLETTLPLMLTMIKKRRLTIDLLVRLLAEKPAEIFNLKKKGFLEQNFQADIVAIDLKQMFKIDASKFYAKAKFSPYNGWEVQGKPMKTFVNGQLIMDEGEIVAKPGSGRIVRGE